MADANAVSDLLLRGKRKHTWTCFGKDVEYELFPVGTNENIQTIVSGLDNESRRVVKDIHDVAYALRSIGGYNFDNSLADKLKAIRAMQPQLFRMFVEELRAAELKAEEEFRKILEDLKVSRPTQA